MYRVLLVDDEPLILSGIRFLIDWEKNGCELVGAARNGRQALEAIAERHPDIVIADINMPVMNGLELLAAAAKEHPDTVFIMLTNLQEFDLVREALRMHAVDYITKTQMEPAMLEESIAIAAREVDRRGRLSRIRLAEEGGRVDRRELLRGAVRQLFAGALTGEGAGVLRGAGVPAGYGALKLWLPPAGHPQQGEPRRLLMWASELAEELAGNCFSSHQLLEVEWRYLQVLYWGGDAAQRGHKVELFLQKLSSVAANVIGAKVHVLCTAQLAGEECYPALREQLAALGEWYYRSGAETLRGEELPPVEYRSLGLSGVPQRLRAELNNHSVAGCAALVERVMGQVRAVPHERAQAVWVCGELYFAACKALGERAEAGGYFADNAGGYSEIEELATRDDVLFWLQRLKNELAGVLEPLSAGRAELLEQVRRYVCENIDRRVTLQDAADHVCISPAYLSSLFKKEYGQNFVDFVGRAKMEKACEMIGQGGHRMNEIAYRLGFENAYYFSKVFRRHIGCSPTEWQKRRGEAGQR